MEIVGGILGTLLFIIGLVFLIPGIIGTAITGKFKHGPKAPRVLSVMALVFGIVLCVVPFLLALVNVLVNHL